MRFDGYGELALALRASGADVQIGGDETEAPFMPVPGRLLTVEGASVHVFDLPDEGVARLHASRIAPDCSTVGARAIAWLASPHFYRSGRSIVLYLGDDARVLGLLERVLGPPIARGVGRPGKRRAPTVPVDDWVPTTRA